MDDCTDFNDAKNVFGLNDTKKQIEHNIVWKTREPIGVDLKQKNYPVDCLPDVMAASINEVFGIRHTTVSALSMFAHASLITAIQPHCKVILDGN